MKAIVYTEYGPPEVLRFREVAKPEPTDNQVLVRVQAASANALDYRRFETTSMLGRFMDERLFKSINKVLGADIAGRVEAVGANVTQFQPVDEVFGVSAGSVGAFAEYACTSENNVVIKPSNLSFEAAAAVPVAALTALQCLRDNGQIQPGQKVLIHGASGGVGTFAVQIAKSFGAEVTALCSTRNLDMARSIGADHVIDYTKADAYGKIPLVRISIKGHIVWQGDHPIVAGAQKVNFIADTAYEVTPFAQGFADVMNQVASKGFNKWEVNGAQSVMRKAFAPFGLAEGQTFAEYDLIYVHDNMLFWGARNVDGRGFDKEENRPTNLQIPLVRRK